MPDWILITAQYLLAPIFGLLGVSLGALLQGRRDDARWRREYEQERKRWQREDRARWLLLKQSRYDAIMSEIDAVRRQFQSVVRYGGGKDPVEIVRTPTDAEVVEWRENTQRISVVAAQALVVGSDSVRTTSLDCTYALQHMIGALAAGDTAVATQANNKIGDTVSRLRHAMRYELGVMDESENSAETAV